MFRRHRRLRENEAIRAMVRETVIREEDFIYPMFVVEGKILKKKYLHYQEIIIIL